MRGTNNEAAHRIFSELDGLAPIIAARAAEAEEAQRIPADIIQMLKIDHPAHGTQTKGAT
jgi:hypothetical protein